MKLTDKQIRHLKTPGKYADGGGLYVYFHKNGSKYWRMKYYFAKKEKLLAIGVYPDISLQEARKRREEAKELLRKHIDPNTIKTKQKLMSIGEHANLFGTISEEWLKKSESRWTARYGHYMRRRLETHLLPEIGKLSIADIDATTLLAALRKIEARGTLDIAHRMLQAAGQIFRYAVQTGRVDRDISVDLKGALATHKQQHNPYLEEKELPEFLAVLSEYDGTTLTRYAVQLALLTFVRTTELRGARWEEYDFVKREWRIPAERMKMKKLHIVPLSTQAISVLEKIRLLGYGSEFVFPHATNPLKYMSNNTMLGALYRMGYKGKTTIHGFRATASTILNENGFPSDAIERQLAHRERNKIRAAYDHAQHLPKRIEMMQWWGDCLEEKGL